MSRPPALSASRAKEYQQCPLKFRYSVVDGLRQPPTEATVKGTVVHKVLEDLFTLPAAERTPAAAQEMLPTTWEYVLDRDEAARDLFEDPRAAAQGQDDTATLLGNYFRMERPENLAPKGREQFVDARLSSGVLLRGIIDRIDEAPDGALRVVDYKTGRTPSPRFMEMHSSKCVSMRCFCARRGEFPDGPSCCTCAVRMFSLWIRTLGASTSLRGP